MFWNASESDNFHNFWHLVGIWDLRSERLGSNAMWKTCFEVFPRSQCALGMFRNDSRTSLKKIIFYYFLKFSSRPLVGFQLERLWKIEWMWRWESARWKSCCPNTKSEETKPPRPPQGLKPVRNVPCHYSDTRGIKIPDLWVCAKIFSNLKFWKFSKSKILKFWKISKKKIVLTAGSTNDYTVAVHALPPAMDWRLPRDDWGVKHLETENRFLDSG